MKKPTLAVLPCVDVVTSTNGGSAVLDVGGLPGSLGARRAERLL